MAQDRFIDIGGARIRYRVEGTGPAVLLVHGLGAFIESWAWTIAGLRDRYTVVAFDFPGFGFSDPVPTAFAPEGAAAFLLSFMDALRIRSAAFIGSSLGGAIAAMAAGRVPGRCSALILSAPAGFAPRVPAATRLATLPLVGEVCVAAIRRAPVLGVRSALVRRTHLPPVLVETARRAFTQGAAGASCLRIVRATVGLRGIRPEVIARVRTAAERVTAPTLLIWGTRDRVVPVDQAAAVARVIRHARTHLMPGAGHAPFIENADAFNAVVREFLSRVSEPVGVGVGW